MINRVVLTGYLVKDIDMRQTQNDHTAGRFTLAVARRRKDAQGNHPADFINCVAWDKQAEILARYTQKGSLIGIEGELRTRSYDDAKGNHVWTMDVQVSDFSFLESQKVFEFRQSQKALRGDVGSQNESIDPFAHEAKPDIPEEDLPF